MLPNYFRRTSQIIPLYHQENHDAQSVHSAELNDHPGYYSEEDEEDDDDSSRQPSINRLFGLLGRNKWLTRIFYSLTYSNLKDSMLYLLDSCNVVHIKLKFDDVMLFLTIFSLFVNNIHILTSGANADVYFDVATQLCFFMFIAELVANSWAKTIWNNDISLSEKPYKCHISFTGYLFSFYWWLDVIAILSLFPDISWIEKPLNIDDIKNRSASNGNYLRMLYTARIVRLVKVIRLARKYKLSSDRVARKAREEDLYELVRIGAISYDEVEKQLALYNERESKLGSQLSESITRRVIIILLLMISMIPLLLFHAPNYGQLYAAEIIQDMNRYSNVYINDTAKKYVVQETISVLDRSYHSDYIVYLNLVAPTGYQPYPSNVIVQDEYSLSWARASLIDKIHLEDPIITSNDQSLTSNSQQSVPSSISQSPSSLQLNNNEIDHQDVSAVLDQTPSIRELIAMAESKGDRRHHMGLSPFQSTASNASDTALTTLYSSDLQIEKLGAEFNIFLTILIGILLVLGTHLLIMGVHTLIIEPIDRMLNLVEAVAKNPLRPYSFENKYSKGTGEYEIQLLQSTISKVTSLLRVCFGEAGAGIISANLTTKHNSTSINPLLPGVRVYAIFGFCDILKFEDINQRLEGDVLTFVNTLAEIVHSRVHSWGGQCNKNLGNAFVIVWRIGDEETLWNLLYKNNSMSLGFVGNATNATHSNNNTYRPKHSIVPSSSRQSLNNGANNDIGNITSRMSGVIPHENNPTDNMSHSNMQTYRYKPGNSNNNSAYSSSTHTTHTPSMNQHNVNALGHGQHPHSHPHSRSESVSTIASTQRMTKLAGVLRGFSSMGGSITPTNEHRSGYMSSNSIHRGYSSVQTNSGRSVIQDYGLHGTNRAASEDNDTNRRKGHNIDLRRVPGVDVLADKALISYLKIIAEINRSKEILKYRHEPRLTLNGSEEFKVRMGFGLHAGWAIEGAVGSLQKVDATYLSPHVNLASRLETASKQYDIPLLFSQNFYDLLSIYGQEYCRKIDVVKFKGSETPIGIYTWDCLQDQDFYLEHDRKAKRRSSMASLHTIMSNLESVVEENISALSANASTERPVGTMGSAPSGVFGRRLSHSHHMSQLLTGTMSRKYSYSLFSSAQSTNSLPLPASSVSNIPMNSLPENGNASVTGNQSNSIASPTNVVIPPTNHALSSHNMAVASPSGQSTTQGTFMSPIHPKGTKTRQYKSAAMSAAALAAAEAVGIAMGSLGSAPSSSNLSSSNHTPAANLSLVHPFTASTTNQQSSSTGPPSNHLPAISHPTSHLGSNPPSNQQQHVPQQSKFTPLFFTAHDDTIDTFSKDYDLIQLRSHIKDDFRMAFRDGLNAYIAGDWLLAKTYFERAHKSFRVSAPMLKCDGPTQTLLEYMAKYSFEAPPHWKGYRQLTSK